MNFAAQTTLDSVKQKQYGDTTQEEPLQLLFCTNGMKFPSIKYKNFCYIFQVPLSSRKSMLATQMIRGGGGGCAL